MPILRQSDHLQCRKFDIRLWVLVTDVNPLTVWLYKDCYLRFCAEDYSLEDIGNVYSHLSNNCIARQSEHFEAGENPLIRPNLVTGWVWHSQMPACNPQACA